MTAITSSVSMVNSVWGYSPHVGLTSTTINVTAAGAWALTSTQPWVRLSQFSGTGNATVTLSIAVDDAFPEEMVGPIPRPKQGIYTATLTLTEGTNTATCVCTYMVGYGDLLGMATVPQLAAPSISPNGGSFGSLQAVTLSTAVRGGTIYYTTDGSEPSPASPMYTGPFTMGSGVVQAIVVIPGRGWSPITLAAFTVTIIPALIASSTATSNPTSSDPVVTSLTINSTGSNFLVASVEVGANSSPGISTTVTDNQGNIWHPLSVNSWFGTSNLRVTQMFYCWNPVVGSGHTITASSTVGATTFFGNEIWLSVAAFSGVRASSNPLEAGTDLNHNTYPTAGTTIQPGSVTPNVNDLVITACGNNTSYTMSIDSGFTIIVGTLTPNPMAYLIAPSSSAVNPTWTYSQGQSFPAANIAVFSHA